MHVCTVKMKNNVLGVLKSNNLNTEEQPAIVPKKGSKDSLADGQPDGFYVTLKGLGSMRCSK